MAHYNCISKENIWLEIHYLHLSRLFMTAVYHILSGFFFQRFCSLRQNFFCTFWNHWSRVIMISSFIKLKCSLCLQLFCIQGVCAGKHLTYGLQRQFCGKRQDCRNDHVTGSQGHSLQKPVCLNEINICILIRMDILSGNNRWLKITLLFYASILRKPLKFIVINVAVTWYMVSVHR